MELYQLVYFKKVADVRNMSKAAQNLFISQPALSKGIKKLEEELGTVLFVREGRQVELTENGRRLLKHVTSILDEMQLIQSGLFKEENQEFLQVLRLASSEDPSLRYFSSVLLEQFPALSILTARKQESVLLPQLLGGEIDLAFTFRPVIHPQIFTTYLCKAVMSISTPPGHELYARDALTWKDLDHQCFLTPSGESFLLSRIAQVERLKNIQIQRVVQKDPLLFLQMCQSTRYLYFNSTIDHSFPQNPLRKNLPVEDPPVTIQYYASCQKKRVNLLLPYLAAIQKFYWTFEFSQDE